jgi:hypothetical protein
MSVHLQNLVWRTVDVHGSEMLLLIAYAGIGDDEGNSIYASDEHMPWKTGIPLRTIQGIKKKWRESGVLVPVGLLNLTTKERVIREVNVTRGGTGGRGWVVLYRLCLEPLPRKKSWTQTRGKKVASAGTFCDEGRNSGSGRSQLNRRKVAMLSPEGRNGARPNKEDPSVEPSDEPSAPAAVSLDQHSEATRAAVDLLSELRTRARVAAHSLPTRTVVARIRTNCKARLPDITDNEIALVARHCPSNSDRIRNLASFWLSEPFTDQVVTETLERRCRTAETRRQADEDSARERQADENLKAYIAKHEDAKGRFSELPESEQKALIRSVLARVRAERPDLRGYSDKQLESSARAVVIDEIAAKLCADSASEAD